MTEVETFGLTAEIVSNLYLPNGTITLHDTLVRK